MTNAELQELFWNSNARIDQLVEQYRSGAGLSRADCIELRKCNERLHLVGRELLLLTGDDGDPRFDCFRQPHRNQPLPANFKQMEVH